MGVCKMNDKKVERHYERRWLDAKSEMIKDAGPVVDFFINMHQQCDTVAIKHNVSPLRLRAWLLAQLPVQELDDGVEVEEEFEDDAEEE
jgi:hypothetical protein